MSTLKARLRRSGPRHKSTRPPHTQTQRASSMRRGGPHKKHWKPSCRKSWETCGSCRTTRNSDFNLRNLPDKEAVNTSNISIKHQNIGEPAYGVTPLTRPDFCIVGVGNSLSPMQNMDTARRKLTYRNVRNMGDYKPDSTLLNENAQFVKTGLQLGRYARQILHEQPNRCFVDSIALSRTYMRVFSFDREGGSYFNEVVNIHSDAVLFVEAVLV